MDKKTFYITTPIFYPNANLHMGHAYTTTLCDIIARYNRIDKDVYLLTGADENTEKVVRAAKVVGKGTNEYLNTIVAGFKSLFDKLEISYDQFIRTSDEKIHWPGAQEMWKRLVAAGDIEKRSYEGLYCVGHEAFITEKDLVDGKCPDHNEIPQLLKEENYFFKLSKYTEQIKKKIESDELEILPQSRKNEILALLGRGLEDVSFSRPAEKLSVGVPVPGDPTQKIYVWCDALVNYISALGFGRKDDELYKKFWRADADTIHVIGKDILRFHAAIWPGMLLSAGVPLPKKILVHGFITSGGKKMSKSLGNVIDPSALIEEYGVEAVRYYLARHVSPFEDGDLTMESFKKAYNGELANGLGNLVSRVMKMNTTYDVKENDWLLGHSYASKFLNNFDVRAAIEEIWNRIEGLDKFIQEKKPFQRIKTDEAGAKKDLEYLGKEVLRIGIELEPFMPKTAKTIQNLIRENKMPSAPLFLRKE